MPTETKSPSQTTQIVAGWSNPTNAYASDDQRTNCSTAGGEQEYSGYGFNIPLNATIDKVEVGVEGYCSQPGNDLLTVKTYDGQTWYQNSCPGVVSEQIQWIDFTNKTTWTPQKANACKTRINYDIGGGDSCYTDKTFLLTVDEEGSYIVKRCSEIKAGDMVLGYRKDQGYKFCNVVVVEKHEGEFDILKIVVNKYPVMKNVNVKNVEGITPWNEYIYVTPNHQVCSPSHGGRVNCGDLKIGDFLVDLHLGEMIHAEILSIEKSRHEGTVYNVKLAPHYEDFFYFIVSLDDDHVRTLQKVIGKDWHFLKHSEFSLFGLGVKTWYVDWLPVRVTYTEAAPQAGHSTKMGLTKVGA